MEKQWKKAGITQLLTKTPGTGGVIKHIPEDFVVEEIRIDSTITEATAFIKNNNNKKTGKPEKARKPQKPEDIPGSGAFIHFTLEKSNRDTHMISKTIARFLHTNPKSISYAGTKDKVSVSAQKMSVKKRHLDALMKLDLENAQIRDFCFKNHAIELGDLLGNRFTINIRDIELNREKTKKTIEQTINTLKEKGMPNYFGLQRFGSIRPCTHLVGQCILEEDFRGAVETYLSKKFPEETGPSVEARKLAGKGEFKEAALAFPKGMRYEKALCYSLLEHPGNFVLALKTMPKNLVMMFVHAYQSFLFNQYLSTRLKLYGTKEIDGDILVDNTPTGPLFGSESRVLGGQAGELEQKILSKAAVKDPKAFKIKKLPEASSSGDRRKITVALKNMRLLKVEKDGFFPGKTAASIQFSLEPGSYATIALLEIMK
ncbi:MAG: tRNA pseudouridine(13) synthase TruD [Candidatus Diapherotrites archaeon]|nr:tRNA pseudouridine(13) synthase TruD [Candidatus Diapherotrites archaeon]